MSRFEQAFCRSAPWRWFARDVVLQWALQDEGLWGDVLEIGSGSGAMAAGILDRYPEVRLTATDFDTAMVASATARLAKYGDRVHIRQADATALDFPDRSFDAVVSFIMLHHVIKWERALREATRVLRPGGMLVGYDLLAAPLSRFIYIVDRSQSRLMTLAELEMVASELAAQAHIATAFGGLVVRFLMRIERAADVPRVV